MKIKILEKIAQDTIGTTSMGEIKDLFQRFKVDVNFLDSHWIEKTIEEALNPKRTKKIQGKLKQLKDMDYKMLSKELSCYINSKRLEAQLQQMQLAEAQ